MEHAEGESAYGFCFGMDPVELRVSTVDKVREISATEHRPEGMLRTLFEQIDSDGDGFISRPEFQKAFTGHRKKLLRDVTSVASLANYSPEGKCCVDWEWIGV